ncbi:MAG: AAA family ATPase [Rhodospirillales bacterium]|nr:AAA family ATPase [Rhodospirillales bacterium]
MSPLKPLTPDALCWQCEPGRFDFETTSDLDDLTEVIGQARAVEAIRFAIGMPGSGYNLYALGPEGIGKHTVVRRFLEEQAGREPAPSDWCYVSNFQEPRKPWALRLPPGRGAVFQADMARFVQDVQAGLQSAFESDEYRTRQQVIEEELKEQREQSLTEVEQEALARGIALLRTPIGFAFGPLRDGKVVSPEAFQKFPEEEQKQVQETIEELQEKLKSALQKAPVWVKQARDAMRKLNDETAMFAVGHLIQTLSEQYAALPEVLSYLDEVRQDVIDHVEVFVNAPDKAADHSAAEFENGPPLFRRYRANLFVDNRDKDHAPVEYEDDPSYDRLIGRIEHRAEMGTLQTDFHMIRPGALHRANAGYLIVDTRKLLTRPLAWEGLKRALMAKEIRIEPLAQMLGLLSTVTLEPEPIPLELKVVLVGERLLYYLLSQYDPEFERLFKVAADFDERFERSDEHNLMYARLVATLARREELRPLDRGGVARVLGHAARLAGDAERLSTEIERLIDLLREADYWAGQGGRATVGAEEVQKAVDSQTRRLDRVRERVQEEIRRGTIVIDTEGEVTGQVNGLSVLQLGGFAFGRPSRITARVRLGKGDVVDIEREVALGGPLHSKGVLILSGYLSAHYASERPLSLSASLVFEQSYGGVDGDSASSAELYTLLSAIAGVPLRQDLAVTGSVNQRGQVQAIGGVNEKIEGFFDLCAARGLNGRQGVMIPAANVKHLMLDRRVVAAVEAGEFQVYPVETIDQGLELLTAMPAGERGADGAFPEDSFNRLVEARLIELAEKRKAFGAAPKLEEGT